MNQIIYTKNAKYSRTVIYDRPSNFGGSKSKVPIYKIQFFVLSIISIILIIYYISFRYNLYILEN